MARARLVYWSILGLAGIGLFTTSTSVALLHYATRSIVAVSPANRLARERCSLDDFAETCKRLIPPESQVVDLTSGRALDDVWMKYAMFPYELRPNANFIFQGNDSTDRLREAVLDSGVDFFVYLDSGGGPYLARLRACDVTEVVAEQCGRQLLSVRREP